MTQSAERFTATCDWCKAGTISFDGPPVMIEVRITAATYPRRTFRVDLICAECQVGLLKYITSRDSDRPESDSS